MEDNGTRDSGNVVGGTTYEESRGGKPTKSENFIKMASAFGRYKLPSGLSSLGESESQFVEQAVNLLSDIYSMSINNIQSNDIVLNPGRRLIPQQYTHSGEEIQEYGVKTHTIRYGVASDTPRVTLGHLAADAMSALAGASPSTVSSSVRLNIDSINGSNYMRMAQVCGNDWNGSRNTSMVSNLIKLFFTMQSKTIYHDGASMPGVDNVFPLTADMSSEAVASHDGQHYTNMWPYEGLTHQIAIQDDGTVNDNSMHARAVTLGAFTQYANGYQQAQPDWDIGHWGNRVAVVPITTEMTTMDASAFVMHILSFCAYPHIDYAFNEQHAQFMRYGYQPPLEQIEAVDIGRARTPTAAVRIPGAMPYYNTPLQRNILSVLFVLVDNHDANASVNVAIPGNYVLNTVTNGLGNNSVDVQIGELLTFARLATKFDIHRTIVNFVNMFGSRLDWDAAMFMAADYWQVFYPANTVGPQDGDPNAIVRIAGADWTNDFQRPELFGDGNFYTEQYGGLGRTFSNNISTATYARFNLFGDPAWENSSNAAEYAIATFSPTTMISIASRLVQYESKMEGYEVPNIFELYSRWWVGSYSLAATTDYAMNVMSVTTENLLYGGAPGVSVHYQQVVYNAYLNWWNTMWAENHRLRLIEPRRALRNQLQTTFYYPYRVDCAIRMPIQLIQYYLQLDDLITLNNFVDQLTGEKISQVLHNQEVYDLVEGFSRARLTKDVDFRHRLFRLFTEGAQHVGLIGSLMSRNIFFRLKNSDSMVPIWKPVHWLSPFSSASNFVHFRQGTTIYEMLRYVAVPSLPISTAWMTNNTETQMMLRNLRSILKSKALVGRRQITLTIDFTPDDDPFLDGTGVYDVSDITW